MILDLNGEWKFRQVGKDEYYKATVPGCNYLDLINNNLIEDPFYKDNEQKVYWVCEEDWEYVKNFTVSKEILNSDRVYLHFDELDTIADVFINDVGVLNAINCHIAYDIDVKNLLKEENTIKVVFKSPVKYVLERQEIERCPVNSNGLTGVAHIRKPQCHFGWDWGPNLNPSGISQSVYIKAFNDGNIKDFILTQTHNDKVAINVNVNVDNYLDEKFALEIKIVDPKGKDINKTVEIVKSINEEFVIDDPQLWYPNGMVDRKEQPLYTVSIVLKKDNIVLDEKTKQVGLRTLVLNQEKDQWGSNFQFKVNGEIVFAKGADLIPFDSFNTRVTKEDIDEYIKIAVESNFNMFRIWGGGYYGSDYLYEQCDKYGILLWQDFMFACQGYPLFMDDFRENVRREVEYNVKRLSHHASLALWCGNNEIECMCAAWILRKDYIDWNEKYFYEILPEELKKYNDFTPYIPGSPVGSKHLKDVSSDDIGDTHLWAVWHGLQDFKYYRGRNTRFCSEFGFESLPDLKCIETFADESDYDINSPIFNAHQKCMSGNKKMQFYITSKYRLPKNFIDYIYLSQICQDECIKDATEHWHRNLGRCNGSLYWQFNDCWPVCSWASVDYYKNYKALQYDSKHFFRPVSVSIEDTKDYIKVFAINDKITKQNVDINMRLISFDGKVLLEEKISVSMDKTSSNCVKEYTIKQLKGYGNLNKCVFVADMYENGVVTNRKTVLFKREKDLTLKPANIDINIELKDGVATYKIKADKFVRKLMLQQKNAKAPFSDNFMDLLPNEELVLTQEVGDASLEQLKQGLSDFDVSRVVPLQSRLKDFIVKAKVFMIPANFGSYFFYKTK